MSEEKPELHEEAQQIIHRLNFCAWMYDQMPDDVREKECAEAERQLDVLALVDPQIASYVHDQTDYFPEKLQPGQYYLGHRVRIDRYLLNKLDTPEKRAQHITFSLIRATLENLKL